MMMPGREYQAQPSRFGFNGKENDNDVKGFGNQEDYGMRIYDTRLGRFLSVDPLTRSFAMLTPFQYASNSPIANIDLDGLEARPAITGREKEGESQETTATKEVSTPGGQAGCADCFTKAEVSSQTWYWHGGGLMKGNKPNKEKKIYEPDYTQAGWYTSEEYVKVLSQSYAVKALATDLSLFNYTSEYNYRFEIKEGRKDLEQFAGDGINDKAAAHLIAAAKQLADRSNFNTTGTAYPSSFNVEDMLGIGVLIKQGIKAFAVNGSNTIYRVVSPGEASDVIANGFRQAPISSGIASYEGKLFWASRKDAKWYQTWVGKGNPILKIKVDKGFIFENGTDAGRLFYYVSPERLEKLNAAIKSIQK